MSEDDRKPLGLPFAPRPGVDAKTLRTLRSEFQKQWASRDPKGREGYARWRNRGPARMVADTEEERIELILNKIAARSYRHAVATEDYRRFWLLFGDWRRNPPEPPRAVPQTRPNFLLPVFVAAGDLFPPLPGETFRQWRDRAFADYILPDLTAAERIERFRERLARVPDILWLHWEFGRPLLYIPPLNQSSAPSFEAALLEERLAAGDVAYPNQLQKGAYFILPPLGLSANEAPSWGVRTPAWDREPRFYRS